MSIDIDGMETLAKHGAHINPDAILALIARMREAEAREQALAAHVERLRGVAENMDHFNDDEDLAEAEAALSDADDALDEVFVRRDAANKAEELEMLLAITRNGDAGDAIRSVIFDRIKKLRRQAGQADTAKESS